MFFTSWRKYLTFLVFQLLRLPCILLAAKANERENPLSLFGRRFLKVEIWWPAVMYSPQDSASTTAVVEVAIAICLKSIKTKGGSPFHTGWSFYGMRMWNHLIMFCYPLQRFSKTHELWSSKATFTIAFFTAVNHNYDHKQRTLKHRNTRNWSKSTNHKSQTMTFWTRWSKLLFPKRSAKMIDGCEKRIRQLPFGLQNLCVFEKRSKLR